MEGCTKHGREQKSKRADVYLHLPVSLPEIIYSASPLDFHLHCPAGSKTTPGAQSLRRAFRELVAKRAQFLLGGCQ